MATAIFYFRYPPDRCKIVGGFGKKTSTNIKADVDVVVYFEMRNGMRPEVKEDVLEDYSDVLLLHTDLKSDDIKVNFILYIYTYAFRLVW